MSQQNVEIVRRAFAYEIYGRGDRAEGEEIFDPYVVMKPAEEGPSYGLDEIRDNFEHWRDAWVELEVTVEELIDAGDRVLLTAHPGAVAAAVESRSILASIASTRFAAARCSAWTNTQTALRPSKSPGCGSRPRFCFA